ATDGGVRAPYGNFARLLDETPLDRLKTKQHEADAFFRRQGITFLTYGDAGSDERLIPFDPIPRILSAAEWDMLRRGCIQRVRALNLFLRDIYHQHEIVDAGIVPAKMVFGNAAYRPEMRGVELPQDVYAHIAGVDLVRISENEFYVLEDNLRTPSGISYVLENREIMLRLFPEAFAAERVAPVGDYPEMLLRNLRAVSPDVGDSEPSVAVLTPGRFNSAYFEHVFLADQMGVELVEGSDLFVKAGRVYMRTTEGPVRVDVIYRRLDDDFLDPLAFRPDSALGVPGLLSVVRSGGVTLANAIGTGVADDKAMYTYVPEIIRFYLGEEPILSNAPTYRLGEEDDLKYALEHLGELVFKEVHGSGGYGMLVGPAASKAERAAYKERVLADPAAFIAQPTLALSTCPTLARNGVAPRHVDLRPFVLSGEETMVIPGGLTRVALTKGSLVVNSSQGGGTKDTWVLEG
ncbi:MAG: circularly permuted type 2 ATP-grasp protein, partial [Alphaproteobacteria bacterium]|nr:circularly permuted type 2 ATP-grasp protein [Alphaproteobacteria bacterium]